MQRRHAGMVVVGLAALLFGRTPANAQLAPSAWPMAYHDLRHTGQSLFIGPQAANVKFDGSPAIGLDGVIYTVTGKSVVAVNPDGTLLWDYPTGRQMFSSPAIGADGSLYVASDSLYAFKP
jgi:outer membrane protein assembly factor BamB